MINNILISKDKRKILHRDTRYLGVEGENLQEILIFNLDEDIVGQAVVEIEFEDGTKGFVEIERTERGYELPVKSSLLTQAGTVKIQLRILQDKQEVFKSEIMEFIVKQAINATENIPDEYPTWIDNLEVLKSSLEEAESERVTAENERVKAEEQRKEILLQIQEEQTTQNNRLDRLETDNDTNKQDISSIKEEQSTQNTNISNLQEDNETNKTKIEEIETKNTEQDTNIQKNTEDIEAIKNSDFATKEYVEQEIANFDFIKIVTELPETGLVNRTYFVPKTDVENNDLYDEYMWVDNKWELLGTKQIEVDLTDYVKNTDYATTDKGGAVKVKQYDCGLWIDNGQLKVITSSDNLIKAGINEFRPIVPSNQHRSIFWGLSKLAGVDLKDVQNVEIGTYPEESKKAIQEMLGIGIGGYNKLGLVQFTGEMGVILSNGVIRIDRASDNVITDSNRNKMINRFTNAPIVAYNLDLAVKTGLISNHLELTEEEKTSALNWLGVNDLVGDFELISSIELTEDVSSLIINTDNNGNPFELKEMLLVIRGGASNTRIDFDKPTVISPFNSKMYFYNGISKRTSLDMKSYSVFNFPKLKIGKPSIVIANRTDVGEIYTMDSSITNMIGVPKDDIYRGVSFTIIDGNIFSGSTIELWGVRV